MAWHERGILIVGGGIAGLSLAAGLRRVGLASEIVEQAPAWAPVGAGIALGVNAMRALGRLQLEGALLARGFRMAHVAIANARGDVLSRTDFAQLEPRFGPSVALHRAALHEVLLSAAGDVPIRLGTTVASLAEGDGAVEVRFEDGREAEYGLVVGADGLRSRTREQLFGEVPVRYAGYTCWRLVVERPAGADHPVEMWGRGRRFGVVPIDAERVYCYAVANAPEAAPDPEAGRVERFRERFREFGGSVPSVIAQVERPEQLLHNDICEVVHEPWYRGRGVLVGDAAHAVTPDMGQGAAMALEDTAVLSELLAEKGPLAETLAAWAGRRRQRVRWVQDQSRRVGRVGQWEGRFACRLRDALARVAPDAAATRSVARLAAAPL